MPRKHIATYCNNMDPLACDTATDVLSASIHGLIRNGIASPTTAVFYFILLAAIIL